MDSDDGSFLPEYFMYFKKKYLNQGTFCPADAAAVLPILLDASLLQLGVEKVMVIRVYTQEFKM